MNNSAGAFILIDGAVMIGKCCHSFMKLTGQGHVVNIQTGYYGRIVRCCMMNASTTSVNK